MTLQQVIEDHGLDAEGVRIYLDVIRQARKSGLSEVSPEVRLTRSSWPSRFTREYNLLVFDTIRLLAPYVEAES